MNSHPQLKNSLSSDECKSYYVLSGTVACLKTDFINRIKERMGINEDSICDYIIFDALDGNSPRDIIHEMDTPSLFGHAKLVYGKNVDKLSREDRDELQSYLEAPNQVGTLILDVNDLSRKDKFIRGIPADHRIECEVQSVDEIVRWAEARLGCEKKMITKDALSALIEFTNSDFTDIRNNLEKLINFIGSKECIEYQDVVGVVNNDKVEDVFDLTNAMVEANTPKALLVITRIMDQGKDAIELIGLLAWLFRRIWTAKSLLAQSMDASQAARRLNIPLKYFHNFARKAASFSDYKLHEIFKKLMQADRDLKGGLLDAKTVMQLLCFEINN